jgi:large subunit ribosomal protein L18
VTLAQANSADPEIRQQLTKGSGSIEAAKLVGEAVAARAKEKGIEKVVFDRGGYIYHGKVKAVAEGAREKGLQF